MDTIRNLQKMLYVRMTGAKAFVDWFVAELATTFEAHQVKPTPCLLMLAEDVVTHGLLVRVAHKALDDALKAAAADAKAAAEATKKTEAAKESQTQSSQQPTGAQKKQSSKEKAGQQANTTQEEPQAKKGKRVPVKMTKEAAGLLDDVFKYREKYRKSMADFSQACAAAGTPIPTGLSELFANVDAKLDGVMAAAMDFQKRRASCAQSPTNGSVVPGAPLDVLRPDVQAITPGTADAPETGEAVLAEATGE